ncbi:hypothetical protein ACMX2H_07425 [Arthrobacter sulfonylureivorans]|uniref:hypothetical protein n=1 Tax=Arthrobacter sulfonylureivorans TaxID=2486855 RepID=UPI0039E6BEDD
MPSPLAPRLEIPPGQLKTFSELRTAGYEESDIHAALQARHIFRLRHGVYISAPYWRMQKSWERDTWMVRAHHLTTRSALVYSHVSAARLWSFDVWNAPTEIHVVQRSRHGDNSVGVVRHNTTIPADQLVRRDGLLLTTPERTLVDCAKLLPFELATVIADSVLRAGALPGKIWDIIEDQTGFRNISKARQVMSAASGLSESPGETRLRLKVLTWGFPPPVLQYELETAHGRYRADMAWPELKLILEFDGDTKYNLELDTDAVLLKERKRETLLMEYGWKFVRVRWPDLSDDEALRRRLVHAYEKAFRASQTAA